MIAIRFYEFVLAEARFHRVAITLPQHIQDRLNFDAYIGYRPALFSNFNVLNLTDQQYSQLQSVYSPHLATLLRAWCIQHHPDAYKDIDHDPIFS